MTICHHPVDTLLAAYAAGTLDQGQHLAIATHLVQCSACRSWVREMETLGGAVLSGMPPSALAHDALAQMAARLDEPITDQLVTKDTDSPLELPGLPPFARNLAAGRWKWLAPNVQMRRLTLTAPGDTRVFLLRSKPGVKMLSHRHTGIEMTCVLTGSFSHDSARYGPGDFDFGDSGNSHEIEIGAEGECISLVAMQGELRLQGLRGRLAQPFISL